MTPAVDTDLRCLHCSAVPTLREMADGWCDSCGKRLPDSYATQAKQQAEEKPAPAPKSRTRWAVAFVAAIGLVAVIAVAV